MITIQHRVSDVREWFKDLRIRNEFITDKTGCNTLEVIGATFIADEPAIFGIVNKDYVRREIEWYESQSRNVHDIPGGAPKAWIACASTEGMINSNYGWAIYSEENGNQYTNVRDELKRNPGSRRGNMIYTRPSMWTDYNVCGMSDFMCTDSVQYLIRGNQLIANVKMRSADAWAGYRNDKAWADYVHQKLASDLGVSVGPMIWHAANLHLYERNFYLVDGFIQTGKHNLTLAEVQTLRMP